MTDLKESLLSEQLKDLVYWEGFAIHLPGIRQPHIDIIKREVRDNIDGQKQALFSKWLQIYPKASWENVIEALEKVDQQTLAVNVCAKLHKADTSPIPISQSVVPRESEVQREDRNEACVPVSKKVIDDLEKMNTEFVTLTTQMISEVESNVENDPKCLKHLVRHVEQHQAFDIDFQSVQTTDDFFRKLNPHYSFLDCYLIVSLALLLSQAIASKAKQYKEETEHFMINTEIINLHQQLEKYFHCFESNVKVKVLITLENAWGKQSVWLVKQLVQQLLCLEHPEQCQWFRITKKCLLLTLSASKCLTVSLLENSKQKLQFMRLVGVISLQIGDYSLFKEDEKEMFSFDNSLIQATMDNNIDAVQFLLEKVKVYVDAQTTQPIVITTPDNQYQTESILMYFLKELSTTFDWLIRDIELQLKSACAVEKGNITAAMCSGFAKPFETTDEFVQIVKMHNSFLSCHILDDLLPLLSQSLAKSAKQYGSFLEEVKKEAKFSALKTPLETYFQNQPGEFVMVSATLEAAWCACSMWFVEKLLQLVFTSAYFRVFQWFRVRATTESATVVFLAPEGLKTKLIEISRLKAELMRISGVISLQIGELKMSCDDGNNSLYAYSFRVGIAQAKKSGNKEVLYLLMQINQAPVAVSSPIATDDNNNICIYPDPDSTALMIACCNDNTEMVKLLLKNNADTNIQNGRKYTALMCATRNHNIFQMLLDHKADINLVGPFNETILYTACSIGNVKVAKKILEKNRGLMDVKEIRGRTELYTASSFGNIQLVELLLQAQADPNTPNKYGNTPLHIASYKGQLQVAKRLLDAQADPSVRNNEGATPLHSASKGGKLDVIDILLQVHSDPNTPDDNGDTPLIIASYYGYQNVVERLIQAKADPNIPNKFGNTPLHIASSEGHQQVCERLLHALADPNIQNKNEETPLHKVSQKGGLEIVELLLKAHADPDIPDNDGATPLQIASKNGHQQIVQCLVQAKAN